MNPVFPIQIHPRPSVGLRLVLSVLHIAALAALVWGIDWSRLAPTSGAAALGQAVSVLLVFLSWRRSRSRRGTSPQRLRFALGGRLDVDDQAGVARVPVLWPWAMALEFTADQEATPRRRRLWLWRDMFDDQAWRLIQVWARHGQHQDRMQANDS